MMWKPLSIIALPSAFACQSSMPAVNDFPRVWMAKSMWQVVPPNAQEVCPDSKSSTVTVPPKGMSKCVCGSTHPRQDVLAGRVDHPVGVDVERRADQRDRLVLDVDVGDVVARSP